MKTHTFPANFKDLAPAPSSHPSAWVGVTIGSHRYAVAASDLLALFQWKAPDTSDAHAPLDVVVHAGSPVFIVPANQLFEMPQTVINADGMGEWILMHRLHSGACLGCRVDQVQGPFTGQARGAEVVEDGVTWTPIRTKKERHG